MLLIPVAQTLDDADGFVDDSAAGHEIGWNRRFRAPSFSICFRYSSRVVAPMHWISPRDSAGLSMFEASMDPSAAPAPTNVCNSSMKIMMLPACTISFMTTFRRSSNWPRYFVPATSEPRSSAMTRRERRLSGTSDWTIRWARPSTMAVLPTPGFPDEHGIVFRTAAENLKYPLDFVGSANDGIKLPFLGQLGQVAAELIECRGVALPVAFTRRRLPQGR